jgi:hypothetical protein
MTIATQYPRAGPRSRLASGPPVTAEGDGDFDVTSLGMSYLRH